MATRPMVVAVAMGLEPWSSIYLQGCVAGAHRTGSNLLMMVPAWDTLTSANEPDWLPMDLQGIAAAASFVTVDAPYWRSRITPLGVPMACVADQGPGTSWVRCDDCGAMRSAVQHLAGHGRRRIAYVSAPPASSSPERADRLAGYRQGLADVGLEYDPSLVALTEPGESLPRDNPQAWGMPIGRQGAVELLSRAAAFDAVVCYSDSVALGLLQVMATHGRNAPDDFSVIGLDSFGATRRTDPPLTSLCQPCYEIGYRMVESLSEQVRYRGLPPANTAVEMHLVQRTTCGCLPTRCRDYTASPEQYADPLWQLARTLFAKISDISPSAFDYLARLFSDRAQRDGLLNALFATMPEAVSRGLDATYAHACLAEVVRGLACSPLTGDRQPDPQWFYQLVRDVAVREGQFYLQHSDQLLPHAQKAVSQLIHPVAKTATPVGLPEALRTCMRVNGGRHFALALPRAGGYDLWNCSADADMRVEHRVCGPSLSYRDFVPDRSTLDCTVVKELWSSITNDRLGFLALDADSYLMPCYGEIMEGVEFVLESLRSQGALEEARNAADAANRAKSAFVSQMSHEIRSPMTSVLGYAELLLTPDCSDEERMSHAQTICRNGQHLLNVVNGILDLSKIEAGQMALEVMDARLDELLADVDSLMRVKARQKQLEWGIDLVTPVPQQIRTDPTRLRQILLNLVTNAIKFTAQGSVRIRLSLATRGDQSRLRFAVQDQGIGISPEQQRKLFRPFQQAEISTSRQYGGTGLGLSISKHLAELMGGTLSLESEIGKGSQFILELPVTPGSKLMDDLQGATRTPVGTEPELHLSGRVLLAEDSPDNMRLIRMLLERMGLEVDTAADGVQALSKGQAAMAAGHPYQVILMDMQMPELDGLQATRRLRGEGYTSPILALTANAMVEDREACMQAGCDGFLSKPIQRKKLTETLLVYCRPQSASGPG